MPTITVQPVQGYAHCRDSMCPGNEQEQVLALREQSDLYYKEWDPDGVPGIMNSTSRLMFADSDDATCPHCGESREVTDQVRPIYPVMTSAFDAKTTDQRFLLTLQKQGLIVAPGETASQRFTPGGDSEEVAELRRQVAELSGMLQGFVAGQAAPQPQTETPAAAPTRRRRAAAGEEPTP